MVRVVDSISRNTVRLDTGMTGLLLRGGGMAPKSRWPSLNEYREIESFRRASRQPCQPFVEHRGEPKNLKECSGIVVDLLGDTNRAYLQ